MSVAFVTLPVAASRARGDGEPSAPPLTLVQEGGLPSQTLSHLRNVALPDGRLIEYVIDGMNRRIGKKINGQLIKGWLYGARHNIVAELDESGSVVSRFDYVPDGVAPSYMTSSGRTYRIVSDKAGTPRRIVDVSTGEIVEAIDVDEAGNIVADTNSNH